MSNPIKPKHIEIFGDLNKAIIEFNRHYEHLESTGNLPIYAKDSTYLSADSDAFATISSCLSHFLASETFAPTAKRAINDITYIMTEFKTDRPNYYHSIAEELYVEVFDRAGLTKGRAFNFKESYRRASLARKIYEIECDLFEQYLKEKGVTHQQIIDRIENPYMP